MLNVSSDVAVLFPFFCVTGPGSVLVAVEDCVSCASFHKLTSDTKLACNESTRVPLFAQACQTNSDDAVKVAGTACEQKAHAPGVVVGKHFGEIGWKTLSQGAFSLVTGFLAAMHDETAFPSMD